MKYFGTSLTEHGHYFWELSRSALKDHRVQFGDLPFNPEALPHSELGRSRQNGDAQFYQFAGYSIWAIQGSCTDKRPGSKSIFFVRELLSDQELKDLILSTPASAQVINKMPFPVKW